MGLAAALLAAFLLAGSPPARAGEAVWIYVGEKRVKVEIARTPEEQQVGLMHRKRLGWNRGMLFVYDRPQALSFWMKNTLIPLSIAFIDENLVILDIQQMVPLDVRNRHTSARPVRFALEMNQEWFQANGVTVGERVRLPEALLDEAQAAGAKD